MSETEETISGVLRVGELPCEQARRFLVRQWNMFGTGDHVTSILDEGTQDSSPSDVSPFPARWVWKYRMPSVRKGRGQTGEKTYPRPRKQRILVIGDGPLGDRIVAALQRHSSYELVGHLHKQHVADKAKCFRSL